MTAISLKIGLVLNTGKKKAFTVASQVIYWLQQKNNINLFMEEKAASVIDKSVRSASYDDLRREADMIILFGGDGTFLHTAHHFIGTGIPLLGINLGRLGFLTEIETSELKDTLELIAEGKYEIEKRMILEAKLLRDNRELAYNFALNDVVVNRGANARMIKLKLFINDVFVNSYRADGLIIATPTGSTAYSLSAGGPIVNPQIRAIVITPICPHTLYVRPMVISENEKLKIVVAGENNEMKITTDGRYAHDLMTDDEIHVSASPRELSTVKLPGRTFYTILHEKMRLGLV